MTSTTDYAAQLRHALSETRIVFESEPAAGDALDYLEAVMANAAAGGGNASIAKETHTSAGAVPVVGAKSAADRTAVANWIAADAQAGHLGASNQPQTRMDAGGEGGLLGGAPLTAQQIDKIENRMIASLDNPMTGAQREAMRVTMVAELRVLNAMGVQPATHAPRQIASPMIGVDEYGMLDTRQFSADEVAK